MPPNEWPASAKGEGRLPPAPGRVGRERCPGGPRHRHRVASAQRVVERVGARAVISADAGETCHGAQDRPPRPDRGLGPDRPQVAAAGFEHHRRTSAAATFEVEPATAANRDAARKGAVPRGWVDLLSTRLLSRRPIGSGRCGANQAHGKGHPERQPPSGRQRAHLIVVACPGILVAFRCQSRRVPSVRGALPYQPRIDPTRVTDGVLATVVVSGSPVGCLRLVAIREHGGRGRGPWGNPFAYCSQTNRENCMPKPCSLLTLIVVGVNIGSVTSFGGFAS